MYLKSIEMQGFKSFASKIKMDFHDGVTGIVGPNGSGKSNVADAVRWVLGEQSAKQLRGGNMQDVIFAGTASRKPLGFASVSITLDNKDHQLSIDYPEVTVTRRLYRSGESEYLLNGTNCRLRDIQELFYDTGIGKEGYSIIGQGQIDRIISDKPEDRRELFDEAVGIVKYKRRKNAAIKKLEGEEQNLVRLTDILTELTRQVGPLEKQAEKAKIYLTRRDELKERELALFVIDETRLETVLQETREKYRNAQEELAALNEKLEKTRKEYEEVERQMEDLDERILEIRDGQSDSAVKKQQLENQIRIFEEQIRAAASNRLVYEARIKEITEDKNRRAQTLKENEEQLSSLEENISKGGTAEKEAEEALFSVQADIAAKTAAADTCKAELLALVDSRASIKGQAERYQTLDEQFQVRVSALNAQLFKLSGQKTANEADEKKQQEKYDHICGEIEKAEKQYSETEEKLALIKTRLTDINHELEEHNTQFHRDRSMLESLTDIAERFEGYGGSVKKVMELAGSNPGIKGVVAELISTDKKYETAIETALGGSLQNVVTDNEATAKYLIEYLKRGKFGRATFLPLTSMNAAEEQDKGLKGDGVIGAASKLVKYDPEYKGVIERLLGTTYVIDTVDHAIALGRKFRHRYRMVTLEGELFNRGGSITGGAYKNNANLLGRKRRIEELEAAVAAAQRKIAESEAGITSCKEERNLIRAEQSEVNETLKKLYIERNTAGVQIRVARQQAAELLAEEDRIREEQRRLEAQRQEVVGARKDIHLELDDSAVREQDLEARIAAITAEIEELSLTEQKAQEKLEQTRLSSGALRQQMDFLREKIGSGKEEMAAADSTIERLQNEMTTELSDVEEKHKGIEEIKKTIEAADAYIVELGSRLEEALREKEQLSDKHKDFFARREEISDHKGLLEKECFRLENILEKTETEKEHAVTHLWEEYEITPLQVERKEDDTRTRTELTRDISALKKEIKELGTVNVNAIEEYKEVKERHTFLSAQYEDIVKSAESLQGIIAELDKSMKKQFNERFADIREEFDRVFRQLFGGGKGTLELLDENDLLETGVRIIAQPPGKKLQNMMQLSGGEKALTAISLLFAIQNLKPSPFCLLDEIEAALDDSNVGRFAAYLAKLKVNTQFIVITHRRGTMDCTDRLYGITMQEKGVSTMVSVDLVEGDLT